MELVFENLFPVVNEEIGHWKIIRHRGEGNIMTHWYDVQHTQTGAIGFCEVELSRFFLPFKAMIVKEATHFLGLGTFQKFVEYDATPDSRFIYLITEALGPKLDTLRNSLPADAQNRFSLATCLYIGEKMLFALQELHEAGYLHRRISDDHFALNRTLTSEVVLIGNTRMRRWLKFDGSGAFPARDWVPFRGTIKYASVNALRRNETYRLDEVWSWFYLVVDLTVGDLPWGNNWEANGLLATWNTYANVKEALNEDPSWLDPTPTEYKKILEYLKSTSAHTEPAYSRLAKLLGKALKRTVDENGGEFKLDWEPGGAYYNELSPVVARDGM